MTDRKNLKISEETYELLTDDKEPWQTWDGYFRELKQNAEK